MPFEIHCAYCGADLSEAVGLLGADPPKWGDAAICNQCAGVNIFTSAKELRRANPGELAELGPITQGVIHAIKSRQDPNQQRAPLQ